MDDLGRSAVGSGPPWWARLRPLVESTSARTELRRGLPGVCRPRPADTP
jgi:hypothetical protein